MVVAVKIPCSAAMAPISFGAPLALTASLKLIAMMPGMIPSRAAPEMIQLMVPQAMILLLVDSVRIRSWAAMAWIRSTAAMAMTRF
jgi:hypothetical protein